MSEELQNAIVSLNSLELVSRMYNVKTLQLTDYPNKLIPSVLQAPVVEMKTLPAHLKYAFLGDGETLPVIVSSKLIEVEEDTLVRVLPEHKEAIGWTIVDIKGISPSVCMHRILLEEGAQPS